MIRPAAVAGSWYPDNPLRLAAELDRYLDAAVVEPQVGSPRALIVPHAGLMYSGPVAAFAYTLVHRASYDSIVLVGPSHFVPFHGVAVWRTGEWHTPFGPVAVDTTRADAIRAACADVIDLPAAHRREHSLEMQLPFVAHLLPGVPIVPLVMGEQTRETAFALGDALARVLNDERRVRGEGSETPRNPTHTDSNPVGRVPLKTESIESGPAEPHVLLVASSDLSHYESAAVASRMDAIMMHHVDALDPDGLMAALEREPRHACGGGPMVSVLRAARALGASSARVLRYADSGDVSGDKASVVGYLAAAAW